MLFQALHKGLGMRQILAIKVQKNTNFIIAVDDKKDKPAATGNSLFIEIECSFLFL
jgi:hypothetical protein